jgi:hypothetical protein
MTIQYINTGSSANAGNGDSLRSAFIKVNNNFSYLSTASFGDAGTGYTGSRGDVGFVGSRGDVGFVGSRGDVGFVGSRGDSGFTGSAGQGIVLAGTPGQLAYYPSTGTVAGPATGLSYSVASQTLTIGGSENTSTNVFWIRDSYSAAQPRGWVFSQHYNDSDVLNFTWNRTRGTFANPTSVITDDDIADLVFTTQIGTTPIDIAAITVRVENTSTGVPSGKFMFFTNSGTTSTSNLVSELSSTGTFKFTKIGSLVPGTNLVVQNSLVPSEDLTYDLGSTSSQWRSLYVGTSTIYLGGVAVSIAGGNLTIDGNPVSASTATGYTGSVGATGYTGSSGGAGSATTSTLVNGTSTITLSSNGNTTFPTGLTLGAPRGVNTVNFTCAVDKEFQIETGTTSTGKLWQFGTTGNTTFPGNLQLNGGKIILNTGGNAYVESVDYGVNTTTSAVNIFGGPYQKIKLRAGFGTEAYWTFGTDGTLTLPAGGTIIEGGGLTGAIKLTPAGGANAYQALLIYPTAAADGDHVHLTAGGGATELYLGDDSRYVKLVNGGNVEIRATTTSSSASAAWSFGTDGAISTTDPLIINVPNGVPTGVGAIASTTGSWEQNPASNLATTGGSGTGLRVSVTHTGGYASAIAITVAGTGYLDGELITVTSGGSSASFIIAVAGTRSWTFGTGGDLTLPYGAVLRNTVGDAIAFGNGAGQNSQGGEAVAIGTNAGYDLQGIDAVAIGTSAGETDQGEKAVAIGDSAGYINQGDYAVAIGHGAGNGTQGSYAVAIGMSAGETNQAANTIILNATGSTVNGVSSQTNSLYVAPIRNASGTNGLLQYNTTTNEVTYSGSITFPDATVQTTAWTGIPGPYADDAAAAAASVAVNYPYHKTGTGGQVFVRLT